ncbi:MAG: O-antigen ligase family protein [Aggregatilineales bacterium]
MYASNGLQDWFVSRSPTARAVLLGAAVGVSGGLIGLLLAALGPLIATGVTLGGLAALYVLTNISAALYAVIAVIALLPFGTLPVRVGFTPTLLDAALGAFLIVYLFQWMTGRRLRFRFTPVHALIALYVLWLMLSFALGLRYALPTSAKLRQFAETLVSIGMVFVLVDLLRDVGALRRLVLVFLLAIGAQTFITLALYALPDTTAESVLIRLARIGYPNSGVIRYIEDNPALNERAIGTWVDPNALGGMLAISTTLMASQLFASRPVLRWRFLIALQMALVGAALFLTYSRASILAFAAGLAVMVLARYRRYIPLLLAAVLLLLLLPQTQVFVNRFAQAFTASDLATQMRLGEYSDSLRLISRYPVFGVGFTGTPERNLYTDVASMYLIMANQIGLVGVGIFLTIVLSVYVYGLRAWRLVRNNPDLDAIHLGLHAALLAALVNAAADLYFFRIDFQASISLFWFVIALCLASSRLALDQAAQVPASAC